MRRHWSETYFCLLCGKRFKSYAAEAKHRHNAPLMCRQIKTKRTSEFRAKSSTL